MLKAFKMTEKIRRFSKFKLLKQESGFPNSTQCLELQVNFTLSGVSIWAPWEETALSNTYFILRPIVNNFISSKMSYKMRKLTFQCKRVAIFLFGVVVQGVK